MAMSMTPENPVGQPEGNPREKRQHPFRKAVLRGLGILLPPLLTIVLFIWAWTIIDGYVLVPVESVVNKAYVLATTDTVQIFDKTPRGAGEIARDQKGNIVSFRYGTTDYTQDSRGKYVPKRAVNVQRDEEGNGKVISFTIYV